MKARAFFRSSKLMLPGAVIGASFMSGFADRRSHWRLAIDDQGNVYQDIEVRDSTLPERQQLHDVIGQDAVLDLLIKLEQLGIASILPPAMVCDDAPIYELAVRYGDINTWLRVQGADMAAAHGDRHMQRFMEVWDAVCQYAPAL